MAHVAVSIVAWNSMKYLPEALASVAAQTFPNLSLIVVDNASGDGSEAYVREHHPRAVLLRNAKNQGFSRAHNQAISYARSRLRGDGDVYMLIMNPDVVLEPDYVARMVDALERRPEAGSGIGKVFRMARAAEETSASGDRTEVIDTAGIVLAKSRRAYDRGEGAKDDAAAFVRTEEVFGPSGALAMYRMNALEDVAYAPAGAASGKEEYFDDDFFAYKEDVDLAWRLRLRGWHSLFVPSAVAYHYRTARGAGASGFAALLNRFRKPKTVNFLSYRNHALLLWKNEHVLNAILHLPWILWYEFRKFVAVLVFEPATLRAIPSALALLPRMLRKRRTTMRRATAKARDIRAWFS